MSPFDASLLPRRFLLIMTAAVLATAPLISGCAQPVQPPGSPFADTADLPPNVSPGVTFPVTPTPIIDGPGYQILIDSIAVFGPAYQPILPGGQFPAGDRQSSSATVQVHLFGVGTAGGWTRTLLVPMTCTIDSDVRPYGANVQSFANGIFAMHGQISGDPDFNQLSFYAGANFGLPGPGHTTLTRLLPGGNWNVDSFFDMTFRIDFFGTSFGVLHGQSGSQIRTAHLQIGVPAGATWNEQGDAPDLIPGQQTTGTGAITAITGALSSTTDVDAYCIQIDNPAAFSASTVGGASFDTQLFLFDAGGLGVTHDDDAPAGGTQSRITGQYLPGPGTYVLVVSAYNRDPVNIFSLPIWSNTPFNVERPPDGPGAPGPLDHWLNLADTNGAYTIQLTGSGVCLAPIQPIPPGTDAWAVDLPPQIQFGGPEMPPIPADFFYPGSQPFTGVVTFGGKPLSPGAGDADTLVQRLNFLDLPGPGSVATIPIEIVGLDLKSADPIVVGGVEWNIEVVLGQPPAPPGTMTVTRTHAAGGTFDSVLPVRPQFIFTPVLGGPDRVWEPGVTIPFNSQGPTDWASTPLPFAQPGGGPGFFPIAPTTLASPGTLMTLEPALALPAPSNCPPLDPNHSNSINGGDVQGLVAAYLAGPSHPAFCAIDANANGIADVEDLQIAVSVLLAWPAVHEALGGWVNVDAGCDYKHHPVTECDPNARPPLRYRYFLVRAADKDGNPSSCPVKFRIYNCDDVPADKAVEVESGDRECAEVPNNRKLEVWCKTAETGVCRISIKEVTSCPPPP